MGLTAEEIREALFQVGIYAGVPASLSGFKAAHARGMEQLKDEAVVTSPKKGGLSVYGTNVLMNLANAIGAMPTRSAKMVPGGRHFGV